ncbi:lytic transglycosylase domain-containing protein [Porticoccus sp. W117]|uniref:lytic transglycosylase domain-containing protein n=1 Tax=Porticoccus sp. W117 TaxID=3054777 RepID=UPI00259877BF|nr:lytic transglycosylase domain-containing protein [Porticoccus sp. W117]MDM3869994.1 lytic transglycosylase domain-containing protein [Porticoccus sp. W117]
MWRNKPLHNILLLLLACLLSAGSAAANQKPEQELVDLLRQAATDSTGFEDKYDAHVWLASKNGPLKRFVKDEKKRLELLKKIHREANRAGVHAEIVLAVIEIESGFDRYAISHAGARGMMQIMPFWKKEIGREDDNLFNTDTNLRYGCTILKYYLDKENGKVADALARYNGSYGTYKYAGKVLDAWSRYWK